MGRTIGAVVVGYVAMFVVVFVGLTLAYQILGTEGAFQPGSYDASNLWIVAMFINALIAAVVGGWLCGAVARNPMAVTGLMILVLVLGVISAVPAFTMEPAGERTETELTMFEAMNNARQPIWVALLTPLVGLAGVWLGGRIKGTSVTV